MPPLAIPYPTIDPVALWIGPLPLRWYALAYIAGLIAGWFYARKLVGWDKLWGAVARPGADSLDDLLVYCALGVVLGVVSVFVMVKETSPFESVVPVTWPLASIPVAVQFASLPAKPVSKVTVVLANGEPSKPTTCHVSVTLDPAVMYVKFQRSLGE